ncbi:MAG: gliding motility protein GldN [Chitinophagaceae bacterium]|jgi:gliding motility associated protien GldN|nr:gliding motility protein GldN [Chitinophagaceae bacterium]
MMKMRKYLQYIALMGFLLGYAALASAQSYDDVFGKSSSSKSTQSSAKDSSNKKTKTAAIPAATSQSPSVMSNLPITTVKSSNSFVDDLKPSLRRDGAVEEDTAAISTTPLKYEEIKSTDAIFRVRVWRDIDARDSVNQPFFYRNNYFDPNGNVRFIGLLLRAVKSGVQAFSADDDRFTTPITYQQAVAGFGGGFDTSARYDLDGNVVGYEVREKAINPDSIYIFRIKEDWTFNRRNNQMYIRILGIAPVIPFKSSTGDMVENSEHAVFWIYYPDLRPDLVRIRVSDPVNLGNTITWEQVFESRMFKSRIVKSTLDGANGFDKEPLTPEQAAIIEGQLKKYTESLQNIRR